MPLASRSSNGRSALRLLLNFLACVLVLGLGASSIFYPLATFQLVIGLCLTVAFWGLDESSAPIPRILRPAPIAFGSLTISSISAAELGEAKYEQYFILWLLQALGLIAGFVISGVLMDKARPLRSSNRPARQLNAILFRNLTWAACAVFLLATLGYFATQGIPALKSDLEQARVDAAQGSSGYIRLLAFLLPTGVIGLVAARARRSTWAVVIALIVMLGFGNRVPFIYFLFPLTVMFAIVDRRITSIKIAGIACALFALMGGLAAWRVYNTADMANSYQYRDAVRSGDTLSIAWSAVSHYADVVPQNAVLVQDLVDSGKLPLQFGSTYFTLFSSILPGRQISPDMLIKQLNGVDFIGGGIPPTLAGEGYMNFGYPGVVINALLAMFLLRYLAHAVVAKFSTPPSSDLRVISLVYGYAVTWVCLAQISGFAGSATISLAGFLVLVTIMSLSRSRTARRSHPVLAHGGQALKYQP